MMNMSKCPYCNIEIHLEDYFDVSEKVTKKGIIRKSFGNFKGENIHIRSNYNTIRMWVCPSCDKILGFSEYAHDSP